MRCSAAAQAAAAAEDDPTPTQIAKRSAEIRNTWTRREHYERAGLAVPAWTVPIVEVPVELEDVSDPRFDPAFTQIVCGEVERRAGL